MERSRWIGMEKVGLWRWESEMEMKTMGRDRDEMEGSAGWFQWFMWGWIENREEKAARARGRGC